VSGEELVYLGLGSNLGDRRTHLVAALNGLAAAGVTMRRRSGLYESAPVGPPDQPWYLNAVVETTTALEPQALLAAAKAVERAVGRQPGRRWGPRVVDVDVLLYGSRRVDEREPWLTIPHPELWRRRFVLAPLQELRPDLQGPDGRAWLAELAAAQEVRPVSVDWDDAPPGGTRM
jgi:2-amino-4-hydroxy-6-hydroxymethyldihydropteridine diphosphokinase